MSVNAQPSSDPALDELERIRLENAGTLRPPEVVEAAADPQSPIHRFFEWDDAKGGHQYRLIQAARLIRSKVQRLQPGAPQTIRSYVSVEQEGQRGYRHIDEVVADDDLRAQAYRRLLNDLHAYKRRLLTYTAYAGQIGPVVSAIDQALKDLDEEGGAAA